MSGGELSALMSKGGNMLGPEEQKKLSVVAKTLWLIYLSFTSAVVMYTVVVFLVVRGGPSPNSVAAGTLKPLFLVISLLLGFAKFWIQTRLLGEETAYSKCRNIDAVIQKYQGYNTIILALCEAPALFGLIVTFTTRRIEEWWLFFGISALLFITSAPRPRRLESIADAHAARHQQ